MESANEQKHLKQQNMKRIILLLTTILCAYNLKSQDKFCDPSLTDEAVSFIAKNGGEWLKDFNIYLPKATEANKSPRAKYTFVLSGNSNYRFLLTNSSKFPNDAQLTISDMAGNIIGELICKAGQVTVATNIKVRETDQYSFLVNFPNGKEGCVLLTVCYLKE
jgi:hypothetical protein